MDIRNKTERTNQKKKKTILFVRENNSDRICVAKTMPHVALPAPALSIIMGTFFIFNFFEIEISPIWSPSIFLLIFSYTKSEQIFSVRPWPTVDVFVWE